MKVSWSKRFAQHLRLEYEFLRSSEPANAALVRDRLIQAAASLAQFPDRGRAWRLAGSRELVVPGLPYVLIYRVKEDEVLIISLFHTSRNWPQKTN
ncbi:MAG TPA: type II toxin-antitoxin system RelE/ParE family toxin [Pirellulales bacterium]|nr:type II toxin-antitoxin system RelE/ParE family toxin [Pirellulales bacterium]